MRRWAESPFVLAAAGTLAIHVILMVGADALVVMNPHDEDEPAIPVEIVDVEPSRVVKEEPPPVHKEEVAPPVTAEPVKAPTRAAPSHVRASAQPTRATEVRPVEPPPNPAPTGGGPTVAMENIGMDAHGTVAVTKGPRTTGHIGRGGTGEGTGAGSGVGAGSGPPAPVSVATIKKRAMPRKDYGYLAAGKDYPTEAKQLGIEGAIRVRLIVDETGKIKSAVLLNHLGHGLDELAMSQAKQIEFEPALDTDDHPVTSVVIWTFDMRLPK